MEEISHDSHIRCILVVDDEEPYRVMLNQFLQKAGYRCHTASGALEALEMLHSGHYDLVISDIRMPDKSGIQLMREAREIFPHMDFIIMTGHAQEYSFSDIIAHGAADFIGKPFEMEKLKSKLERLEREKRLVRRLEETNQQLHDANQALAWESAMNSSLAALAESLLASSSIGDMSMLALKYATELTKSPVGFVGYVDQKTGHLVIPAMTNEVMDRCRVHGGVQVFEKFSGLWGWVLLNCKPILTNQPHEDPRSSGIPEGHIPVNRFLSAPAVVGRTILGQISVANAESEYTQRELTVLERMAAIFAMAIQRLQIREELQQARDYLENTLENAAEAIGIVDARGRFTKWNKAAEDLYGYKFEELKGKPFHDLYSDKETLATMLTCLRRDGFVNGYEIDFVQKDGKTKSLRLSIRLLKDEQGSVVGSVAVAMDLTDLKDGLFKLELANKQLQSEIIQRERLTEELREAKDKLEKLVIERTERLSQAGSLLKRSIDRFKEIEEET